MRRISGIASMIIVVFTLIGLDANADSFSLRKAVQKRPKGKDKTALRKQLKNLSKDVDRIIAAGPQGRQKISPKNRKKLELLANVSEDRNFDAVFKKMLGTGRSRRNVLASIRNARFVLKNIPQASRQPRSPRNGPSLGNQRSPESPEFTKVKSIRPIAGPVQLRSQYDKVPPLRDDAPPQYDIVPSQREQPRSQYDRVVGAQFHPPRNRGDYGKWTPRAIAPGRQYNIVGAPLLNNQYDAVDVPLGESTNNDGSGRPLPRIPVTYEKLP